MDDRYRKNDGVARWHFVVFLAKEGKIHLALNNSGQEPFLCDLYRKWEGAGGYPWSAFSTEIRQIFTIYQF